MADENPEATRVVEAGTVSLSEEHQCVNTMAELMKNELDQNMEKKGGRKNWRTINSYDHVLQVYEHNGKLQMAVRALRGLLKNGASRHEIAFAESQVKEYAADVANHALMVLDCLGLLELPKTPAPKLKAKPGQKKRRRGRDRWGNSYGYGS